MERDHSNRYGKCPYCGAHQSILRRCLSVAGRVLLFIAVFEFWMYGFWGLL